MSTRSAVGLKADMHARPESGGRDMCQVLIKHHECDSRLHPKQDMLTGNLLHMSDTCPSQQAPGQQLRMDGLGCQG